jgi:hypothetical protein
MYVVDQRVLGLGYGISTLKRQKLKKRDFITKRGISLHEELLVFKLKIPYPKKMFWCKPWKCIVPFKGVHIHLGGGGFDAMSGNHGNIVEEQMMA